MANSESLKGNTYGFKHGGCPSGSLKGKPYVSWQGMMTRCYNENNPGYLKYGAKGITVCDRWKSSFQAFYDDMGPRPKGTTIDRIESTKDYTPGNCRWAKPETQNRNRPSFNKMLTFEGKTHCVAEWAEIVGIPFATIHSRLRLGWSDEDALTRKVGNNKEKKISFNGERMNITEWSKMTGIKYRTLANRIKKGWSIERALTEPTHKRRYSHGYD